jgi:hypothetical protein
VLQNTCYTKVPLAAQLCKESSEKPKIILYEELFAFVLVISCMLVVGSFYTIARRFERFVYLALYVPVLHTIRFEI